MSKSLLMISALDIWSMKKKGGAQSLWYTIKGYADNGWNVFFLSSSMNQPSYRNLHKNIHINNLSSNFLNQLKNLKGLSFLIRPIWWIYFQIGMFILGHKIAIRGNINLVYGYEVIGVPVAKLLSLKFKIPLVSRFQGTILKPKMKSKYWKLRHWHHYFGLKIPADITIMTNDGTSGDEVLRSLNRDMNSVRFWLNGVDDIYNPDFNDSIFRKKIGINEDTATILCVSRLAHWKRVDRIIKALSEISSSFPNIKLLVIGDGPERHKLETLVSSLGIQKYVKFTGALRHDELSDYYNLADIFVSLYDLSNVGNPLLEAMLCGKCIITLNNGDTSRFVKNGENGILINMDNLHNIPTILYELLKNKVERIRLGKGAREFAKKKFWSWDDRIDTEIQTIRDLITK